MESWAVTDRRNLDDTVHVWPLDDLIRHDVAGSTCVCGPRVVRLLRTSTVQVIHGSLDGRELSEV